MNPQAFRRKLENAVELRDQMALERLREIASESPATARIWHDHVLVEQAIQKWKSLPVSVAVEQPLSRCSGKISKPDSAIARTWIVTTSLLLLVMFAGAWYGTDDGNSSLQPVAQLTEQSMPVFADGVGISVGAGVAEQRSPWLIPQGVNTVALSSCSLMLQNQNGLLLSATMWPVMPESAVEWEQQMLTALDAIGVIPGEVQQIWQKYSAPFLGGELPLSPSSDVEDVRELQDRSYRKESPVLPDAIQEARWSTAVDYLV